MVDLTITPTAVLAGSNARTEEGVAGEAITAGQLVYRSSTTHKFMKADTNSVTAEARKPSGVALNGASLDQPIEVQTAGDITIGATLVAGTDYYASDTPGGICPRADVGATENVVLVGLAKSTTVLGLDIQISGVTLP
jgi:hypothetical protein